MNTNGHNRIYTVLIFLICFSQTQFAVALGWSETGDAGDLPATAQIPVGTGALDSISGVISTLDDVDMFKIFISSPAAFSVSVTGFFLDSMIALFDQNGRVVYANDDAVLDDFNAKLPAAHALSPSVAGIYYLAMFDADNAPFSSTGLDLLPQQFFPWTEILGPTGPGGGLPVDHWFTQFNDQSNAAYIMFITGAQFVPAAIPSEDIVIDFGGIGLWARMNDAAWLKLNNASPDQVVVGDMDGNGEDDIIADFSSAFGGIFVKRNLGPWEQLHNFTPDAMAVGDLDNNGKDDIVIDFGGIGLWARMNNSNWLKLNNASPAQMVVGDIDGNGADDVIAVFSSGIFVKRNLGAWGQLHNFTPEAMAVGDLDGNGKDDIVIDFGGIALWARMNDSSWLKLNNTSPDLITTGDLDGNGSDDVIATFSGSGLWQKLNLGGWNQLNPNAPDEVLTADVDGSGQDDIIADFGSTIGGIFVRRNQGAWSKLHNFNPDSLAVGNLDGN